VVYDFNLGSFRTNLFGFVTCGLTKLLKETVFGILKNKVLCFGHAIPKNGRSMEQIVYTQGYVPLTEKPPLPAKPNLHF
jgi:hypothetical protein